ncbi:hypothetical protein FB451DRAFT_672798 [Mycena latifolia]|nr:hypothetical protein FB451DRAFT_672798 [Mycena latifolia]
MSPISFTLSDPPIPPGSLAKLIASNDSPCSEESRLASAYIDELEPHITSIDEEMAFLSRRREALLQSLNVHQSIVSPIRRLPSEILGEIFAFSVHSTYYFQDIAEVSGPLSHQAPWVLTRVCRRWAKVSLENPALWSMVFLDLDRLGERGAVSMTKLWLARSKDLCLTLKIFHDSDALGRVGLDSHPVLSTVMQHSERWEHAYISISLPLLFQLATIRGRLPALNTLTISANIEALEDMRRDALFQTTFAEAPRLTALCASFWDDRLLRSPFAVRWPQLTRLSTTFTSNTEALSILQQLSNIVECRLQCEEQDVLPADGIHVIRLQHLRFLTIQVEAEQTVPVGMYHKYTLLNYFETPCLEKLSTHNTADVEAVLALIARSGCADSLKSLHLHLDSIGRDTFLRLVRQLPRLTALELGDFNGSLTGPDPSVPAFFGVALHRWLQVQRSFGQPPQSLHLRIVDRMYNGDASLQELSAMQRDGLFLEISAVSDFRSVLMDSFN